MTTRKPSSPAAKEAVQKARSKAGGHARAAKLSPKQRRDSAQAAAQARWANLTPEQRKAERAKGRAE